jgi:hypothetical protein
LLYIFINWTQAILGKINACPAGCHGAVTLDA